MFAEMLSDMCFCWQEKLLETQCSLTAKMKKAMHLQDMEVKNATEWKVIAESVEPFLPLRPFGIVGRSLHDVKSGQAPCR